MSDSYQPVDSPHPDLQVNERENLVAPYPPAESPSLLYRGPMLARWREEDLQISVHPDPTGELTREAVEEYTDGVICFGTVRFALWPDPHISWSYAGYSPPFGLVSWPEMVPPSRLSPCLATRASPGALPERPKGSPAAAGTSRVMFPVLIGDPNEPINEVRSYLVNFQVIQLTNDIQRGEELDSKALLQLRAGGWEIDIERRIDFAQAMNHAEERRGYAVTHNCRLRRRDAQGEHQMFTFRDAEPALEAVQLFTSFVRGGMVGVALPVGYLDGDPVIEQWHVTAADSGRYPDPHRQRPYHGWFLWYDGLGLGSAKWLPPLFDQFAAKWWDPNAQLQAFWRNVLRGLIYTYTDAERMDESRGVVPACTALETLCWAILVETERWLTGGRPADGGENEYDKLTVAGQLRLLLRWAGIPTGVPGTLPKLLQKATSSNWDGPQVVVWVRNRVVHPDRREQLVDGMPAEALHLALWYTELVVLKMLGYDGYFRDSLDAGKVKRVSWAAE